MNLRILSAIVVVCCCAVGNFVFVNAETHDTKFYIDGRVKVTEAEVDGNENWIREARVVVDDGQHIGILKPDGRFRIHNLPANSYVVEVTHPKYTFEPIRVDINSEGKRRARRLDRLQPSEVSPLPYPLRFTARRKSSYFQQKNKWNLVEILSDPTIVTLFLPILVLLLLLNMNLPQLPTAPVDSETRQAKQDLFRLPWNDLPIPDLSELVMRWLGDWTEDKDESTSSKQQQKARQKKRNGRINSEAPQNFESFCNASSEASGADNAKDKSSRPSASRRQNRKKNRKNRKKNKK